MQPYTVRLAESIALICARRPSSSWACHFLLLSHKLLEVFVSNKGISGRHTYILVQHTGEFSTMVSWYWSLVNTGLLSFESSTATTTSSVPVRGVGLPPSIARSRSRYSACVSRSTRSFSRNFTSAAPSNLVPTSSANLAADRGGESSSYRWTPLSGPSSSLAVGRMYALPTCAASMTASWISESRNWGELSFTSRISTLT